MRIHQLATTCDPSEPVKPHGANLSLGFSGPQTEILAQRGPPLSHTSSIGYIIMVGKSLYKDRSN